MNGRLSRSMKIGRATTKRRFDWQYSLNLAEGGQYYRSLSSYKLPEPTWSLSDLELSKQHDPVTQQELQVLAKRALLHVPFNEKDSYKLRQELGNMMHMIQQVSLFDFDKHNNNIYNDNDNETQEKEINLYDKPRGVTGAPFRSDEKNAIVTKPHEGEEEEKESEQVFASFLQPQTVKVGAHNYFCIETKREKIKK